jgi:hypothetical protein
MPFFILLMWFLFGDLIFNHRLSSTTCGTVAKVFKLFCFVFFKRNCSIHPNNLVKSLCVIYQHLHEMIIGNIGAIFLTKKMFFILKKHSFVGYVCFYILKMFLKKFKFFLFFYFKLIFFDVLKLF